MSQLSNSRDFEDDEDYDENLEAMISGLENEIFQIPNADFVPLNFDAEGNFTEKENSLSLEKESKFQIIASCIDDENQPNSNLVPPQAVEE